MKKLIIPIVILVLLILGLIPIKEYTSERPYYSYNAFLYKSIKYYNDSLYGFKYKEEIHIFPTNFMHSNEEYFNRQIHQVYATSEEGTVETILGNYIWNKKEGDAIFPIARPYKETLPTRNNETIRFIYLNNVKIDDVMIYDVTTTESLEDKINHDDYTITPHDLEKGDYIISIRTINKDNKVEYSFKINIEE